MPPQRFRHPPSSLNFPLSLALISVLLLLLLLVACENNQLEGPYNKVAPPPPPPDTPSTPRINISSAPSSTSLSREASSITPSASSASHHYTRFLKASSFSAVQKDRRGVEHKPDGLLIGTIEDPLLVGDTLADHIPVMGRGDLRILSAPQPVANGIPLHSESYVRLDFGENTSGEIIFNRSQTYENVQSKLFFEEDKPIFEYDYFLQDSAFPLLVNQQLAFFGHTYVIKEASNTSVTLYGLDVDQWLVLQNNTALELNRERIAHTRVFVDPGSIRIRYKATGEDDGGIALLPGESLRDRFPRPDAFLNPLFDIRYDGFDTAGSENTIEMRGGRRATLRFSDVFGNAVQIHAVLKNGTIIWGENDAILHHKECRSLADYCISLDEEFLLVRPEFTSVMEWTGVNGAGNEAKFKDWTTGETHIVKLQDTGMRRHGLPVLDGAFRIDDATFPMRILLNGTKSRASIDFDGNGGVHGSEPVLLAENGVEIRFGENSTILFTEPELYGSTSFAHQRLPEEELTLRIIPVGGELRVNIKGLDLYQQGDERRWYGMSGRGVAVTLYDSEDGVLGQKALMVYEPLFRTAHATVVG